MILRDVRQTLKDLEAASASRLAAELQMRRSEVETALEFWIQRGNVRVCRENAAPACGTTCTRCPIGSMSRKSNADAGLKPRASATPTVVYEWVTK